MKNRHQNWSQINTFIMEGGWSNRYGSHVKIAHWHTSHTCRLIYLEIGFISAYNHWNRNIQWGLGKNKCPYSLESSILHGRRNSVNFLLIQLRCSFKANGLERGRLFSKYPCLFPTDLEGKRKERQVFQRSSFQPRLLVIGTQNGHKKA